MIKKNLFRWLFLIIATPVLSQNGTIIGQLTEEQNGQKVGLPFANVFLKGTTLGGTSDFDGNFSFVAPEGTYVLMASFMGYETFQKEIQIIADSEINVNVEMKPEGVAIEGVQVTAKMNRESEAALIMEQKNSAIAVEAIGAQQLYAQGISNAAAAVTKVTGITKSEGTGSLNVRGLGDRYTTTTLNRLPIPSNNPVYKNIELGLFTTDIISHISIEKTYTSSLYGDFGGANINITSKRLTGNEFLTVGVKVAQNSSVFGLDEFMLIDGPNKTGFYNEELPGIPKIRTYEDYGFSNSLNPKYKKILPDMGMDISGGKKFKFGDGDLNTFFTLAFDNEKKYTERIERVVSATGVARTNMEGQEYKYETMTSGLLNLNYSLKNSEFYFNSLMLNSSDESSISLYGNYRDVGENSYRRRGQFERNMLLVNQFLGEHKFDNGLALKYGIGYNYVWNVVPDRRQIEFTYYDPATNQGELDTESAGRNFRYYHDFSDQELAVNTTVHREYGINKEGNYKHKFSLGYSGKFRSRQFIHYHFNEGFPSNTFIDVDDADSYINNENFVNNGFTVVIVEPRDKNGDARDGEEYSALIRTNGVFALWEWSINDQWLLLSGMRVERAYQEITTRANQIIGRGTNVKTFSFPDSEFEFKLLPGVSLKCALNEKQNVRLAGSKTYTLPQLQEMPFMSFSGITEEIYGNPFLKPSDVYNADIKWEFFPKGGLLSATAFYKRINNPINKTTLAGTLSSYFVANTGDWAYVYGFEVDAKKDVYKVNGKKLFVSGNLSILDSKMELNRKKIQKESEYNFDANFNDTISSLQGAAPMLANVSIGYSIANEKNKVSLMLVYNYTSDRLYAIGQSGRGNEYEKATNTLDFVVKSSLGKIGIDLSAKNILNEDYERIQENKVEESNSHIIRKYKNGVSYSISLKCKF